jgi:hypothetical protein
LGDWAIFWRLGDFCAIGRFLGDWAIFWAIDYLGQFFQKLQKQPYIIWASSYHIKICVLILTKILGWATFWAIFSRTRLVTLSRNSPPPPFSLFLTSVWCLHFHYRFQSRKLKNFFSDIILTDGGKTKLLFSSRPGLPDFYR